MSQRYKIIEVVRVDMANEQLKKYDELTVAERRRLKRIAAANIIRVCRRPDGRELSDVAVAMRVHDMLPSEVREVREEIERNGYLAEEIEQQQERKEGGQ